MRLAKAGMINGSESHLGKSQSPVAWIDGVTFEAIEESGVESFLEQIRAELLAYAYRPMRVRKKEIPKHGAKSAFF